MSNPEEPQLAIAAPPQPRQPANIQGLLKFAMEATKLDDAPQVPQLPPLDEDRKFFLQQALHSLTIDVIETIQNKIKVLESVHLVKNDEEAESHLEALETISEYVCDIDTANDFHKIGGFSILIPCMKCSSPGVRAEVCNLLAELSQNNPNCQNVVLESGLIPILINLVETDPEVEVVVKAIYAISCNVRQNEAAFAQLVQHKGIQVFLKTLNRNEEKLNTKICFLLTILCGSQIDFRSRLVFFGYIPVLFSLISNKANSSHEHILKLLYKLVEDDLTVINECKQQKYNGKEVLENFLKQIKGQEQFEECEEYCNSILHILFTNK